MKLDKTYLEKLVNVTEEDAETNDYDWYDIFMIVVVIISLVPLAFHNDYTIFWWIEVLCTVFFIIDYILRWITAPSRKKNDKKNAYLWYPFTPSAIIDLITILPIFTYLNPTVRVLRMWRLVRILRVARLFRYYEPLQTLIKVFKRKAEMLLVVLGFAVFYILITALIMFNVEQDATNAGNHFFDTYWDAIYWATCTLTTVGYGDIYPVSTLGRIISMISAVVGVAIIALPSGILTQGYQQELEDEKKEKEKKKAEKKE